MKSVKKYVVAALTLLKDKVFLQALSLVIGAIAMVFSKTVIIDDSILQAVATVSGSILVALSYGSALVTGTSGTENKESDGQ